MSDTSDSSSSGKYISIPLILTFVPSFVVEGIKMLFAFMCGDFWSLKKELYWSSLEKTLKLLGEVQFRPRPVHAESPNSSVVRI